MRTVTERIAPSSMPRQRADRDPSDSVPAPAADDAAQEPLDFGARVPESYDELYRLAERVIFRRRPGTSIRATSLVHETYLRLTRSGGTPVRDDRHLLALAARAMRQVLVDRARRRGSLKAFTFRQSDRLPFLRTSNQPVAVIQQRFTWFGVRKHLDPAFDSKQARNTAQNNGFFSLLCQFASTALRCDFSSDATRSEGCAP